MKTIQIIRNVAVALAATIAVAACSDDLGKENPAAQQPGTITLTKTDVADTRLAVTDEMTGDGEKLSVKWKTGDKIVIGNVSKSNPGNTGGSGPYSIIKTTDEGKTATFDISSAWLDHNQETYTVFTGGVYDVGYTINNLTQIGNNNTNHLTALVMAGDYTEPETDVWQAVAMKHTMSVLKFVIVLPADATDVPNKVVVTGSSTNGSFAAKFKLSDYLTGGKTVNNTTDEISLNLTLNALPADRTLTVYVPVMQINPITSSLSIELKKDATPLYTFSKPMTDTNIRFAPGKIYTNTLVFDGPSTARIAKTFDNNVVIKNYRFANGSGTSSDPFLITSPEELLYLATQDFAASNGKHYSLTTDIHITADRWRAIGTFQGIFHGNGCVISGKMVNTGTGNFGFFQSVSGSVENLNITAEVISGSTNVGAIAGTASGTITNCKNWGTVTGKSTVGGIVGTGSSTLTQCINYGDVKGTSTESGTIGGIIGYGSNGTFTGCINYGSVTSSGTKISSGFVGGIAGKGEVSDETKNVVFLGCKNYGALKGWSHVGGIVGEFGSLSNGSRATIHDCHNYATSMVATTTSVGNEYLGKLTGANYGVIYSCCTSVNVPGVTYMYGHTNPLTGTGSPGNTLTTCGTSH
ncbi:hypothetical protein D0T50_11785 [Bacteroides sp. 214]|uniref:fimbrillin family protein n=1 Tax=Bacteroides sp. 214 TaxID=2302935 RepID=UPI0013D47FDB|nr:fimbrillin family protein [Bacteroides sp. 214]NDW13565.1 hypothetical protein [Bacteroides sp. 214]